MTMLLIILLVIALVLLAGVFMQKQYTITSSIVINKPREAVFGYIKYLKNQDYYSKWILMDPQAKKEYRGEDATVGFVSAWDSENKKVGTGEQEIKAITENSRIDYEIRFLKPFTSTSTAYLVLDDAGENQTKATWGFAGYMKYPMNLMIPIMKRSLVSDLSTGLSNLKALLEKEG